MTESATTSPHASQGLLHRIIAVEAGRVIAEHDVIASEEYLADHFPGFAVLPGVMMLECMTQAARRMLTHAETQAARPHSRWIVKEVRNLRYGLVVRPGDCLQVEVTLRGQTPIVELLHAQPGEPIDFQITARVGTQTAAQGRLSLIRGPFVPPTDASKTSA